MNEKSKREFTISEIHQVGLVVKDVDRTAKFLSSLGIGPWGPLPGKRFINRKVRGKPCDHKVKVKVAQVGPIQLELIQHLEGECIQKEFLESKGEGINHLGIFVKDIDKKIAELEKRGLKLIQSGTGRKKGGFAYFDTGEAGGGLLLELLEWEEEES